LPNEFRLSGYKQRDHYEDDETQRDRENHLVPVAPFVGEPQLDDVRP
jgi:hypothetical protein